MTTNSKSERRSNQTTQISNRMNKVSPIPLERKLKKAIALLNTFSEFTEYQHGPRNPYLKWLGTNPALTRAQVIRFLCFWYPVSRHQPQILLKIAAAYPNWADRRLIMLNYWEEDGMAKPGDSPHYDLLEALIEKMGGKLKIDRQADKLVTQFHKTLDRMTPAQATGYVAAIEHPALDISAYFRTIIRLCGHRKLLTTDPYLTIHVDVEPDHIIWAHGNALRHMKTDSTGEILDAYQKAMSFWEEFWSLAFTRLNYPGNRAAQIDLSPAIKPRKN